MNNFAIALFVPSMFAAWAWGTYIFFAVFLLGGFVSHSIYWPYSFFLSFSKTQFILVIGTC